MTPAIVSRAKTLLENTKRLRFFRGQVYDSDADEYLRQLHGLLEDVIAYEQQAPTEADMRAFGASDAACYKWPDDTPEHKALRAAYIAGAADCGGIEQSPLNKQDAP